MGETITSSKEGDLFMPRRAKKDEHHPFEEGSQARNIQTEVSTYISMFFQDKDWFCGGPIPRRDLTSDATLKTVLRTQFDDRWEDCIHNSCLPRIPPDPKYKRGPHLAWSVHYLLGVLHLVAVKGIPKEFHPGLVLLYFKFCHGFKIPPPPEDHEKISYPPVISHARS